MRILLTTAAVAAIALGAAACSKPAQENAANAEATSANGTANATSATAAKTSDAVAVVQDTAAAAVGAVAGSAGAATPAAFVDNASQSDMYEMAASKLALQRSKSPGIKAFAREMIKAHTQTTDELERIVSKGEAGDAKIAQKLDNRRQGLLDNLEHASANDFDSRFVDQQANAHREAEQLMNTYAAAGSNAALKAFAAKTAPAVHSHLSMVVALDKANADKDAPNGNPDTAANPSKK